MKHSCLAKWLCVGVFCCVSVPMCRRAAQPPSPFFFFFFFFFFFERIVCVPTVCLLCLCAASWWSKKAVPNLKNLREDVSSGLNDSGRRLRILRQRFNESLGYVDRTVDLELQVCMCLSVPVCVCNVWVCVALPEQPSTCSQIFSSVTCTWCCYTASH